LPEAEFENKSTVFPSGNEELKVLISHHVAETLLREEIIKLVTTVAKTIETQELNLLIESTERANEL